MRATFLLTGAQGWTYVCLGMLVFCGGGGRIFRILSHAALLSPHNVSVCLWCGGVFFSHQDCSCMLLFLGLPRHSASYLISFLALFLLRLVKVESVFATENSNWCWKCLHITDCQGSGNLRLVMWASWVWRHGEWHIFLNIGCGELKCGYWRQGFGGLKWLLPYNIF